jgi:hypothetical protein
MPAGSPALVDRLASWKSRFGPPGNGDLHRLLARIARARFRQPAELVRLHEAVLFLRGYPRTAAVARLADAILRSMEGRVGALRAARVDQSPFEDPEVSGIAGTAFSAVFSYPVACRLAARHPDVEIDWEAYDDPGRAGPVARRFIPLLEEDWPVEAHLPFRRWLEAARPRGRNGLRFLLERIAALPVGERDRGDLYDGLQVPLRWRFSNAARSRSRLALDIRSRGPLYCHKEALIERRDVSLADHLQGPPLGIRHVPEREAGRVLDLILEASAMRYRELYGFSHPDVDRVFHADAGRGVDMYFFGVPPAWRLPVRAYHGGMFFKNGVPAGYVETLSVFERAEVGFNLYYTFREGESAWIYARWLRLFHQVLGVNTFSVDPYQIGHENEEAIQSGAFWFYRKLGFRPADPEIARRAQAEEDRLRKTPGARSSARTLRRLAAGCVLFEGPGASPGAWDRFQVRNLGLAVARATAARHGGDPARMAAWAAGRVGGALGAAPDCPLTLVASLIPGLVRWPAADKTALLAILKAKSSRDESRYLRLMQRHARFRAACLRLGSEG